MPVRETSREAFEDYQESGGETRDLRIHAVLMENPGVTTNELVVLLRKEGEQVPKTNNGNVGSVLTRLRDERGLVVELPRRECSVTGKTVITWKAVAAPVPEEERKNYGKKTRTELMRENAKLRARVAELEQEVSDLMDELNKHHEENSCL